MKASSTSSLQYVATTIIVLLCLICTQFVNCQISKSMYYADSSCSGVPYATFYLDSSCNRPTPGECIVSSLTYGPVYIRYECASEIPPNPTYNFMSAYTYKNESLKCSGPMRSAQLTPMNVCVIEFGGPYFSIIDSFGNKNWFYDSKCTNKMMTSPLFLDQCLSNKAKYTTLGGNNNGNGGNNSTGGNNNNGGNNPVTGNSARAINNSERIQINSMILFLGSLLAFIGIF